MSFILSHKAIEDLRLALRKSYGDAFDSDLSDEEVSEIGELLLVTFVERIKLGVISPEVPVIPVCG